MPRHPTITTPGGEELVLVPRAEYDVLIAAHNEDAADIAAADAVMAGIRRGDIGTTSAEETKILLAAASPLAGWRKVRGLTQAELAATVGISQNHLSSMETGKRAGTTDVLSRLARALSVRIEDLIDD